MADLSGLHYGNGAGAIRRMDEVVQACKGPMTRIRVGSITMEPRAGNIGETYYFDKQKKWSMNSRGLPNIGMRAYGNGILQAMVQTAHGYGKGLWANVSGFSPQEYARMTAECFRAGVDGVEVNLSCPNVWGADGRKDIPALSYALTNEVVEAVRAELGEQWHRVSLQVGLKLSPTRDIELLRGIARIANNAGLGLLAIGNTVPDQERYREEDGKPALAFRTDESDQVVKHKGGLAGSGAKKPNLETLKLIRPFVTKRVRLCGAGGIFDAEDACDFIKEGASEITSTTGYMEEGNRLFEPMLQKLADSPLQVA